MLKKALKTMSQRLTWRGNTDAANIIGSQGIDGARSVLLKKEGGMKSAQKIVTDVNQNEEVKNVKDQFNQKKPSLVKRVGSSILDALK